MTFQSHAFQSGAFQTIGRNFGSGYGADALGREMAGQYGGRAEDRHGSQTEQGEFSANLTPYARHAMEPESAALAVGATHLESRHLAQDAAQAASAMLNANSMLQRMADQQASTVRSLKQIYMPSFHQDVLAQDGLSDDEAFVLMTMAMELMN